MGQINFCTLSESQKILICQQFNINPNDSDAESKINCIMTESKNQVAVNTALAHNVFEQYEAARGNRLAAEQTYTDMTFSAKLNGQSTETNPIQLAYNKFMSFRQTEQSLYAAHDRAAATAMASCYSNFFAMG